MNGSNSATNVNKYEQSLILVVCCLLIGSAGRHIDMQVRQTTSQNFVREAVEEYNVSLNSQHD